jgi:hypothetical protein
MFISTQCNSVFKSYKMPDNACRISVFPLVHSSAQCTALRTTSHSDAALDFALRACVHCGTEATVRRTSTVRTELGEFATVLPFDRMYSVTWCRHVAASFGSVLESRSVLNERFFSAIDETAEGNYIGYNYVSNHGSAYMRK